jgi:uncharacterized membrane protein YhaH (DUF805 family)
MKVFPELAFLSLRRTIFGIAGLKGRSRRLEFLVYWIAIAVLGIVPFILISAGSSDEISSRATIALSLILLVPLPALLIRRLHDQDRSGWWALSLLPSVLTGLARLYYGVEPATILWVFVALGNLSTLAFLLWPGSVGENRFGPNPRKNGYDR